MPLSPMRNEPAGLIRVTVAGSLHGSSTNNVLHFLHFDEQIDANFDWTPVLTALATAIMQCVIDTLLPGLTSDWALAGIRARVVAGGTPTEDVVVSPPGEEVGALGQGVPAMDAGLITLRTNLAGRRNRGRFYVAGIPEQNQAESTVTGSTRDALVNFIACILAKYHVDNGTEADTKMVVFSRSDLTANPGNVKLASSYVRRATVNAVIASMRSRRPGVGA